MLSQTPKSVLYTNGCRTAPEVTQFVRIGSFKCSKTQQFPVQSGAARSESTLAAGIGFNQAPKFVEKRLFVLKITVDGGETYIRDLVDGPEAID